MEKQILRFAKDDNSRGFGDCPDDVSGSQTRKCEIQWFFASLRMTRIVVESGDLDFALDLESPRRKGAHGGQPALRAQ